MSLIINMKREPENYEETEQSNSENCNKNENFEGFSVHNMKTEINSECITIKADPTNVYQPESYDLSRDQKPENSIKFEVTIKQEQPILTDFKHDQVLVPEHATNSALFINDDSEEILDANCKSDGRYVCPICQTSFTLKGNLQRHLLNHKREKFECNICFRHYFNKKQLDKHKTTHLKIKHTCDECGKQFPCASKLGIHKRVHLAVKPFQCHKCERQYTVKSNLIKHLSGPECKKPELVGELKCNVCHKHFEKKYALQSHLKRHSTEKPYECNICHSFYKYKSTVLRHEQLHKGIKPFSCKICRKTFTHAGLIKPHMRKHTGEKPYQCDQCHKWFSHKHNMQRHIMRHAKKKNLVCDVCKKVFPKESRLKYHMRTHTNTKPFLCHVCPKTFSHKQNIIRHYSSKHPTEKYESTLTDAGVAKQCWDNMALQQKKLSQQDKEEMITGF